MWPLHLVTDLLEMKLKSYGFWLPKKNLKTVTIVCILHSLCAPRWAACWCWPGPMWIIAQKSSTTHRCSASSATSATRKLPPSFWSLGPVWMSCLKMAWVPSASLLLQDTWDWSCCYASVGPRWEHTMMHSKVTQCIICVSTIHGLLLLLSSCIFTRWITQIRAVSLGWFTLLSEDT